MNLNKVKICQNPYINVNVTKKEQKKILQLFGVRDRKKIPNLRKVLIGDRDLGNIGKMLFMKATRGGRRRGQHGGVSFADATLPQKMFARIFAIIIIMLGGGVSITGMIWFLRFMGLAQWLVGAAALVESVDQCREREIAKMTGTSADNVIVEVGLINCMNPTPNAGYISEIIDFLVRLPGFATLTIGAFTIHTYNRLVAWVLETLWNERGNFRCPRVGGVGGGGGGGGPGNGGHEGPRPNRRRRRSSLEKTTSSLGHPHGGRRSRKQRPKYRQRRRRYTKRRHRRYTKRRRRRYTKRYTKRRTH